MSTQVFTIPRFMLTLGKVAADNMKIRKQALIVAKRDEVIKKKLLLALTREVKFAEKETKKQIRFMEKEAKVARQSIITNLKKENKLKSIDSTKEFKLQHRLVKGEITRLNRAIARQEKSINKFKTTIA